MLSGTFGRMADALASQAGRMNVRLVAHLPDRREDLLPRLSLHVLRSIHNTRDRDRGYAGQFGHVFQSRSRHLLVYSTRRISFGSVRSARTTAGSVATSAVNRSA